MYQEDQQDPLIRILPGCDDCGEDNSHVSGCPNSNSFYPLGREPRRPPAVLPSRPPQFRFCGRIFFLTYPRCPLTKETILEKLRTLCPEMKWAVVCNENHQDGTLHGHAVIHVGKVLQSRRPDFFDLEGFHPNIQAVRSVKKVVDYVKKKGDFLQEGEFDSSSEQKKTKMMDIAEQVRDGRTLEQIHDEYPEVFLSHKRKIEDYYNWRSRQVRLKEEKLRPSRFYTDSRSQELSKCLDWVNANVLSARLHKQKQLYIQGPSDMRKTSFCLELQKYFHVYWMQNQEDFYDNYSDEYDLVVLDEFRGHQSIAFLLRFLEGAEMEIRVKGATPKWKYKNMPVIICTNHTLRYYYSDLADEGAMQARLEVVDLYEPLPIDEIKHD